MSPLSKMSLAAALVLLPLGVACDGGDQDAGELEPLEEDVADPEEGAAFDAEVPSEGDAMNEPFLTTASQDPYGPYMVNREGQVLYIFTPDSAGEPTCYGDCAEAWPPYLADAGDPEVEDALDEELLGTVERRDGSSQVTWAGWPVYFYAQDRSDAPTGQDVHSHGGEWYLIGPEGRVIRDEPAEGGGSGGA